MYLNISPDVASIIRGHQVTAISLSQGERFDLEGSVALIWQLIELSPTRESLISSIRQASQDDFVILDPQINSIIDDLVELKLVELSQDQNPHFSSTCESHSIIETSAIADAVRKTLKQGHIATIEISSSSMEPLLSPGDRVIISHRDAQDLIEGEVVACIANEGFLIHRFIKLVGNTLITRGDAEKHNDSPLSVDTFVGVVSAVTRASTDRVHPLNIQDHAFSAFYNTRLRPLLIRVAARLRWSLINFIISTHDTGAVHLWRAIYMNASILAARACKKTGARSTYLIRSTSQDGFIPGGSDIDLLCILQKETTQSLSKTSYLLGKQIQKLKLLLPMLTEPLVLSERLYEFFSRNFGCRALTTYRWKLIQGSDARDLDSRTLLNKHSLLYWQIFFIKEILLSYSRFCSFENLLISQTKSSPFEASRNYFARYEMAKHTADILLLTTHLSFGFQHNLDALYRSEMIIALQKSERYPLQRQLACRYAVQLSTFSWPLTSILSLNSELKTLMKSAINTSGINLDKLEGSDLIEKAAKLTIPHAYQDIVPLITDDMEVICAIEREAACQHIIGLLYTLSFNPLTARSIIFQMMQMIVWFKTRRHFSTIEDIQEYLPSSLINIANSISTTTVAIVDKSIASSDIDILIDELLSSADVRSLA